MHFNRNQLQQFRPWCNPGKPPKSKNNNKENIEGVSRLCEVCSYGVLPSACYDGVYKKQNKIVGCFISSFVWLCACQWMLLKREVVSPKLMLLSAGFTSSSRFSQLAPSNLKPHKYLPWSRDLVRLDGDHEWKAIFSPQIVNRVQVSIPIESHRSLQSPYCPA